VNPLSRPREYASGWQQKRGDFFGSGKVLLDAAAWIVNSSRAGTLPIFISAVNAPVNSGSGCGRRWEVSYEIAVWPSICAGESVRMRKKC